MHATREQHPILFGSDAGGIRAAIVTIPVGAPAS